MGVRAWGLEKLLTLPGLLEGLVAHRSWKGGLTVTQRLSECPEFSVSLLPPLLSGSLHRNLGPESPPQRSTPISGLDH